MNELNKKYFKVTSSHLHTISLGLIYPSLTDNCFIVCSTNYQNIINYKLVFIRIYCRLRAALAAAPTVHYIFPLFIFLCCCCYINYFCRAVSALAFTVEWMSRLILLRHIAGRVHIKVFCSIGVCVRSIIEDVCWCAFDFEWSSLW